MMNDRMKPNRIKSNFDDLSRSKAYADENRRRVIPRFDDFYMAGVQILSCDKVAPRILDLGAGTGLYAEFVVARYPDAKLSLMDFSEEMIALAKKRFDKRENVDFIVDDYMNYDFENQLVWLSEAGFSLSDCIHKYLNFAVLYARK